MTKRTLGPILACFLVLTVGSAAVWAQGDTPEDPGEPPAPERPWEAIDIAILLDTSASMEGLIDAARGKLWEIVHDLTFLDPTPRLRVALLTFGNNRYGGDEGWVRVDADLTRDLDLVSERLFALTSEGGAEYVGRVLEKALTELEWTPSDDALKLIFVAGNEAADQDPEVSLEEMSDKASREGILVHAIFCGTRREGGLESWTAMAELMGVPLAKIDHDSGTIVIRTPYDQELADLSASLNETYMPVGEDGRNRRKNIDLQDRNARKLSPSAAAARAEVKSSPLYSAVSWDLVDAMAAEELSLADLDENELPEELLEMSPEERELYVEETRFRREELRQEIQEVSRHRRRYVAEQMKVRGLDDSLAFDAVVRRRIREQLEEKGWEPPED